MSVRAGCSIQCKRHEQLRGNRGWVHSMSSGANQEKMKNRDKSRKWMWWLLGSIAALQMYFVRELLAAFALFAMGFLALASIVVSLYTLHRVWAVTVARDLQRRRDGAPAVPAAGSGAASELRNRVSSSSQSTHAELLFLPPSGVTSVLQSGKEKRPAALRKRLALFLDGILTA